MTVQAACRSLSDIPPGVVQRFRRLVDGLTPDSRGCLTWPRPVDRDGYGHVHFRTAGGTRSIAAHRMAMLLEVDEIPAGMVVDHLCRIRSCVNVRHMRIATIAQNVQAGIAGYANQLKTHCPSGHAYEGDNVRIYVRPDGGETRICRECNRAKAARCRRKAAIR